MIGIYAMIFGLIMLGVIKLYEARKKDTPKPLLWIVVVGVLVISVFLAMTRGCAPERIALIQ